MQLMHVLCGFDNPTFEKAIVQYLAQKGVECKVIVKLTKLSIKEYIKSGQPCDAAILLETMPNRKFYAAEEIADLTDDRDINIVVMVSARRYGTSYLQTLYTAGVTSAFLQKGGRQSGAKVRDLGELLLNRRSRKDARVYYGLEKKKMDLGLLDNESFIEFYESFKDEKVSPLIMERFVAVCSRMTPEQISDFIRRLPEVDLDELKKYEEFYGIIELLRKVGIKFKVKRPKKVSIGLTKVAPAIEENKTDKPSVEVSSVKKSTAEEETLSDAEDTEECIEGDLTMDMLMELLLGNEPKSNRASGVKQKEVREEEEPLEDIPCGEEVKTASSFFARLWHKEEAASDKPFVADEPATKPTPEKDSNAKEDSALKRIFKGKESVTKGVGDKNESVSETEQRAVWQEDIGSAPEDDELNYEDCELFFNSSHQYIAPICVGVVVVISLILIILCCFGMIDFSILV